MHKYWSLLRVTWEMTSSHKAQVPYIGDATSKDPFLTAAQHEYGQFTLHWMPHKMEPKIEHQGYRLHDV